MPIGFIHGLSSVAILIIAVIERLIRRKTLSRATWLAMLALITINCFSLNKDVELFSPFSNWVYGYLGGMYAILILYAAWVEPPKWLRLIGNLVLGAGIVMALYFTISLLPVIPIGFFGLVVFGLGVHVFAPIALFITLVHWSIMHMDDRSSLEKALLYSGIGLPITIAVVFAINWNFTNAKINQALGESVQSEDLPRWVNVAQHIPDHYMTQLLLVGDFKYDLFKSKNFNFFFDGGGRTVENGRIHNPLINIAHLLTGSNELTEDERIKILRTTPQARHQTERKLWTGRDLSVSKAETNIEIHPKYRFAYTEKTFFIKNNARYKWDQQEALFTFYLPEGSTATSLSLWVNGKEEKSRLTTREKADSAYVQIVGVQRRDPALLHWQEGNRLTLTVFPCTPAEQRKVKVGITTPLRLENNELTYQNISVEGPVFLGKHQLNLSINGDTQPEHKPRWLRKKGKQYQHKGRPKDDWQLTFPVQDIPIATFSFNNNCYQLQKAKPQPQSFKPKAVYLDINASWTNTELETIYTIYQKVPMYAYNKQLVQINNTNKSVLFKRLIKRRFSIFPVQQIKGSDALLITKQGSGTPYLSDFENGTTQAMMDWSYSNPQLKVFCLSKDTPGYLERFTYARQCLVYHTNIEGVEEWSKQQVFPDFAINSLSTTIEESGINITKTLDCDAQGKAPDHLLRLYNYNAILERNQLDDQATEPLIELANEAFVVSPISSLIVLETIRDYERFGIDTNEKSLQNAKIKGAGAVPEPHEWALIILCSALLLWAYKQQWIR